VPAEIRKIERVFESFQKTKETHLNAFFLAGPSSASAKVLNMKLDSFPKISVNPTKLLIISQEIEIPFSISGSSICVPKDTTSILPLCVGIL
jgi:hypothetical protein